MTIVQSILLNHSNKASSFTGIATHQHKRRIDKKKSEIKSVSMTIKVIEAHAD